ncbi:F-actin-capping protein subunit alpha-2-like [Rhea pennata]|uniref:F-actin-capping protein subunit alpha-2-like n=1 Tax=Rhea pennata TaxID=8795 RepID=UPI002E264507
MLLGARALGRTEQAQAIANLLRQCPAEEFAAAFSDLRVLLADDSLLLQEAPDLCAWHNKVHFTPVRTPECQVLLTCHNALEANRFFDPQTQLSFQYDHVRGEASDFQAHAQEDGKAEMWRTALEEALGAYVSHHYPKGLCSVFVKDTAMRKILVACIQASAPKPSPFWSSLWKSEWTFTLTPSASTQVMGTIDVQAHYFEGGNIHLTVCKEVTESLPVSSRMQAIRAFVKLVEDSESQLQAGLMEEYQKMNGTYLKAFRRQLPITHSMIDWEKIMTGRIVKVPALR